MLLVERVEWPAIEQGCTFNSEYFVAKLNSRGCTSPARKDEAAQSNNLLCMILNP